MEETRAQRGCVTCPGSYSSKTSELTFELKQFGSDIFNDYTRLSFTEPSSVTYRLSVSLSIASYCVNSVKRTGCFHTEFVSYLPLSLLLRECTSTQMTLLASQILPSLLEATVLYRTHTHKLKINRLNIFNWVVLSVSIFSSSLRKLLVCYYLRRKETNSCMLFTLFNHFCNLLFWQRV